MNTTRQSQTDHDTTNRSPSWRRPALLVTSLALLGSACGAGTLEPTAAAAAPVEPISTVTTPADGTVSIAMSIDNLFLVALGSFEVTDGAEVLGCSRGSFFDDEHDDGSHTSVLTCLAGARTGTFEVNFHPEATGFTATPERPEYFAGPWTISDGTGDFQQLGGGGDMIGSQLLPAMAFDTTHVGQIEFGG